MSKRLLTRAESIAVADDLARLQAENKALRDSLVVAGTIMQHAVDIYYVGSGKVVIDGQDGYGPLREMRLFLEGSSLILSRDQL